jgi:hypothetical protein
MQDEKVNWTALTSAPSALGLSDARCSQNQNAKHGLIDASSLLSLK